MNVNVLGIDIAKNIFQLHGADKKGKKILKKRIERTQLTEYVANLSQCTIVMESCGGSNYWARVFQSQGHIVKLISPQFVKPFVKTNKNDANDAEAMVEASSRPAMHYVPVKQVEQQDIQSIHRVRSRLVKNRTALINEIRRLNLEYGIAMPQGAAKVKNILLYVIDNEGNELTASSRELMRGLYDELIAIEARIKRMDQKIKYICKKNDSCRRLLNIPGIGELTANKNARIIWSLLKTGNEFDCNQKMGAA
ncbi:IS110 family RNA-guided transposase [Legionella fallonii]|uniref:Transposase n=1 Tax=Legionella fallonii LLAP-10 TaxID=1212491 RepID=A0A098G5S8_9GAMM